MGKNPSIRLTNKLSSKLLIMLVIIQLVFGIGIIVLLKIDTRLRINQLEQQIIYDKKESLKITTKFVYETISRLYEQAFDPHYISENYKRELSAVIDSTTSLLSGRYIKLKANPRNTVQDIKEDMIRMVKTIRYEKKDGYIWIHNNDNIVLAHGVRPSLEGQNLAGLKDTNGKLFFIQLTKMAQNPEGGFVDYYWPRPGQQDPQLKLSFVKKFKPFDWILGTGIYIDDVLEDKVKDMKELVSNFRYSLAHENQNYFWINDLNSRLVVHPFRPDLINKDVSKIKDTKGKYIFNEFIKVGKEHGEGFVEYYWPKPGEKTGQPKLAFVKVFKPLNWVIGTGVYINDITDYVLAEEKKINYLFYRYVMLILIATAISIVVTLFIVKNITSPLARVVQVMEKLAQGDLKQRLNIKSQNEIGWMSREIDKFVEILRKITSRITSATDHVKESSSEISVIIEEQSSISTMQSESVAKITSTVEELSASSRQIAEHSNTVLEKAIQVLDKAEAGVVSVNNTAKEMEDIIVDGEKKIKNIVELGKKSQEINTVMEIINNIADQTKLIAFNAALEASSAGEAGKRFGVVAVEIRRLADSVMESTNDIATMINEIQESINQLIMSSEKTTIEMFQGKDALAETIEILKSILEGAKNNTDASKQISISINQQNIASEQVVTALREISDASDQNARTINKTNGIVKKLLEESDNLKKVVRFFAQGSSTKN